MNSTSRPAFLVLIVLAGSLPVLLGGCAAGRVITYPEQLLAEADSLFANGRFDAARIRYTRIRDNFPGSPAAPRAQFGLGYLDVYYDNPTANWDNALQEFKSFSSRYGTHSLIDDVNSWIRILVVLQSFKQQYDQRGEQVMSLQRRTELSREQGSSASHEVLLEAVRKCYSEKDTLLRRIRVLNEVIESIEATR